MTRNTLDQAHIHPAALAQIENNHAALVAEVQAAITAHKVVVVGMGLNPFPAKARKILDGQGTPYTYLSYGNYFSQWRPRLALKLWSGWSTFPMIFVNGTLIGGANDLQKLIASGEFQRMLAA
ncbi:MULTISPECIES: glutaredoxin [unclassified Duganella]|jgi:monothiol glutaredoxin|uniref:glutaredoxin n=1 Tax=unclassified Duganella TaxID=2636909 RepID=UPI00087F112D|nr:MULTISPECIES: glutaredoxin [unclassified Duganella]SDF50143.1 Glutaredoxin-related protein [Duganella sp. OV458]SDI76836.1 Glutaredoxin-related protein [Duganella sp. OV510]